MRTETKACQNCKAQFTVEPEDFIFYEKIQVPSPTWCPECRLVRRLLFFNERTMYKRSCDLCKKDLIAVFPQDSPYTVYCAECWHSDAWDAFSYGQAIDFTKPFLRQVQELFRATPQIGRNVTSLIDSDYCNCATYLKNCYLVFNSDYDENCMFSTYLERSRQSLDIYMGDACELCYDSSNLYKDYRVQFSQNCNECIDVSFSKNLVGCSNCFGCANLRNKSYCIFNKPYTKEGYASATASFNTGSYRIVQELKARVEKLALGYPKKHAEGLQNVNVTGDYVFNSKNTFLSYEVGGCEDCKYCHFLFLAPTHDSYDYTMWGGGAERMYECMGAGGGASDIRFCANTWLEQSNMEYSKDLILGSHDVLGCIALKKKRFCILNKQYEEREYRALRAKVIQHMNDMPYVDAKGRIYRYGEFFPPEMSPFGYNESLAQAHFPLTREQAEERGYQWQSVRGQSRQFTVANGDLPDNIKDASDALLAEIIECAHRGTCTDQCPGVFRLTPQELEFYREESIPLPRLCPNCRHYSRFFARNPLSRFWRGRCGCAGKYSTNGTYQNAASHTHGDAPCQNVFQTTYALDRPEIVYCEPCYNSEVV